MAMEYVDGETFEGMVRRRGPIPATVAVPLIKQALQGLGFAHRIGVVHRDLKPSNLMLNQEGTVKVVDFGIAKKLQAEAGLTGTNVTIGTPLYMSPEQVMGKPVDARTDIYSMGIVLYELLAGQVPFKADSIYEIQAAHVQKIPEPPTIHYPHIPAEVVNAVMKALQKDPGDRFASAEDFIRALPDLPAMQAPSTSPAPIPAKLPPAPVPTRQPQVYVASQAIQAGTQVATFGKTIVEGVQKTIIEGAQKAPIEQQQTSPRGGPNKTLIAGLAFGLFLLIAGGATWLALTSGRNPEHNTGPVASGSSVGTGNREVSIPKQDETAPPPDIPKPVEKQPEAVFPPEKVKKKDVAKGIDNRIAVRPARPTAPPQLVAGQELSGVWQGTYADTNSQEKTLVRLSIRELNGKDVVGTLKIGRAHV
jgi:serine/threonine protein kinase